MKRISKKHSYRRSNDTRKYESDKEKQIANIILLIFINILIAFAVCAISQILFVSTIIIFVYEMVLLLGVICFIKGRERKLSGLIGPWVMIFLLVIGVFFNIKYTIFDQKSGLLQFGHDESIICAVSIIICASTMILVNKYSSIGKARSDGKQPMDIIVKVIIFMVMYLTVSGQILLFNAVLPYKSISNEKYLVTDKYISELYYSEYILSLMTNENQSYNFTVDYDKYKKTKVGDAIYVEVIEGGLGIQYIESN